MSNTTYAWVLEEDGTIVGLQRFKYDEPAGAANVIGKSLDDFYRDNEGNVVGLVQNVHKQLYKRWLKENK